MPEGVEVCAGSPKKDESQSTIRWKVEDPSEFRPEMPLSDMGKDEADFRVFNVSMRARSCSQLALIKNGNGLVAWRGRCGGVRELFLLCMSVAAEQKYSSRNALC